MLERTSASDVGRISAGGHGFELGWRCSLNTFLPRISTTLYRIQRGEPALCLGCPNLVCIVFRDSRTESEYTADLRINGPLVYGFRK
jgi:hypothetical protein